MVQNGRGIWDPDVVIATPETWCFSAYEKTSSCACTIFKYICSERAVYGLCTDVMHMYTHIYIIDHKYLYTDFSNICIYNIYRESVM